MRNKYFPHKIYFYSAICQKMTEKAGIWDKNINIQSFVAIGMNKFICERNEYIKHDISRLVGGYAEI